MSGDADLSVRVTAAIVLAEAEDLLQHEAGACHLSEWPCSHCEANA